MKILHFSSNDDKFGSAKCLKELVVQEKLHGHTPVVVTPNRNNINLFCDKNDIENYSVNYQQFMIPKHNIWLIFKIKFLIRKAQYFLGINKSVKNAEQLIDLSSIDLIHTNLSIISIGALIAKKHHIKHVWHIREFGKEDFNMHSFMKNYISFMNRHCDRFIAISDVIRNKWIEKGIDANKIFTCYDGVEAPSDERHHVSREDGIMKIALCGSLCAAKGQDELVRAVSMLPSEIKNCITVDLYGSGTKAYTEYLQKLILDNKLTNVNLKGYTDNLLKKLEEYDVGMICSKSEGFGRITVEYMLAKLYIIASDTGANPELLVNGNYGKIYKKSDIASLSKAIETAFAEYKTSCIGELAYKHAMENFIISDNIEKLLTLYETTIYLDA